MSCRVFGRQLEVAAMNIAVEAARRQGVRRLVADYIATPKNKVIHALYSSLGFTRIEPRAADERVSRWFLDLADHRMQPHHIACAGAGP
jgi:predicted enzyme involved in methoxymalonyl-ACP biosynthesis